MFHRFLAFCVMLVALTFAAGSVSAAETMPLTPLHSAAVHRVKHRVHKKRAAHKKHTRRHHKRHHIAKKATKAHHKVAHHKKKAMHAMKTL